MKNIILTGSPLFLLTILTMNSCIFPQNNCFKEYSFEINYTCTPQKDTFRIGDTIWIESLITPNLINQLDNALVDVSDIDYKFFGAINRYDTPFVTPPEYNFLYISHTGGVTVMNIGPYAALNITYERTVNNIYSLKFGCVPQNSGLYEITFAYLTEDYHSIDGVIDNACTETINFNYAMNNNDSDNNYYLLEGYPRIATAEGFKQGGSYAFWVVE